MKHRNTIFVLGLALVLAHAGNVHAEPGGAWKE